MQKNTYKVRGKVWLWPAETAAWYFVNIDDKQSAQIKKKFGAHAKGFGSLPVKVELGGTVWKTSIFPNKEGPYILPLKAAVRKKEGIFEGDTINFTSTIGG